MCVTAIVGANWGDEGKGKLTDFLAENADIVVRFQGGSNAGHTIINKYGKFALHLLPAGVFYPHVVNVIGPGVAVNVNALLTEIEALTVKGIPFPDIVISDRAQIILPHHIDFDVFEEERLGEKKFGSTRSGIAPFYSDKYSKIGIQIADLFESKEYILDKIRANIDKKNILLGHLYNKPQINEKLLLEELLDYAKKIEPFVANTTKLLNAAIKDKKRILLEGQLGALRDPDHGIYPFTTSTSTLAGFSAVGAGISPVNIKNIIAVVKAYSSCVGAGPFVSEIFGAEAEELRQRGGDSGEYGATTGRPRRIGWFDAMATRYGCMLQGATEATLTLLDVLSYLEEIPVCTGYEINGKRVDEFPATPRLYEAKPVMEMLPGWNCEIKNIRKFEDLPVEAQQYVDFIEKEINVPIRCISVGSHREQTITRQK